jgi:hypothetical protein
MAILFWLRKRLKNYVNEKENAMFSYLYMVNNNSYDYSGANDANSANTQVTGLSVHSCTYLLTLPFKVVVLDINSSCSFNFNTKENYVRIIISC